MVYTPSTLSGLTVRLALYILIAVVGIFLIPFAIFYYEAEDDQGYSAIPDDVISDAFSHSLAPVRWLLDSSGAASLLSCSSCCWSWAISSWASPILRCPRSVHNCRMGISLHPRFHVIRYASSRVLWLCHVLMD